MTLKERTERRNKAIEAARQEVLQRCAHCRIYVPPVDRIVWVGDKFYCGFECRDSAAEVAAMYARVE